MLKSSGSMASPIALENAKGPSALALEAAVRPAMGQFIGEIAGRAGSAEALKQVRAGLDNNRLTAARPMLAKAAKAINSGDPKTGKKLALKGLEADERNGFGWYLLAMSLELLGDFGNSLRAYEAALKLLPDATEVANDLGRLALKMGMRDQAEKLFLHYLAKNPGNPEGTNNLATAIRDEGRYDEAIEVLRPVIMANPANSMLWNTMGSVAGEKGDVENALIFFSEAVKLDPSSSKALYNFSNIQQLVGDFPNALRNVDKALTLTKLPAELAMMRISRFSNLASLGRIEEAWNDYETRLSYDFTGGTHFMIERPMWKPGDDVAGKKFLLMGEQGLGDEVLFANTLPDLVEDLGPDGELIIAVEGRLIPLFQRSCPQAKIVGYRTIRHAGRVMRVAVTDEMDSVDLWAPMASLFRQYRRTHDAFPQRSSYLTPDPERVAHWRKVLEDAPPGPKIGLLWKSAITKGARHRFFSPLEQWRPVLTTPGASFVNLQCGDCEADLAYIKDKMGVEVWQPPGIDLKQDLDDVAALCCAVDLVVGFSNATFNLGAACGAPSWLIAPMVSWPRLGLTDRYLWYPLSRMFVAEEYADWDKPMADIGRELTEFCAERQAA